MGIQKLTAMTSTDMTPLLNILQEHAVPKYFDSVALSEDGKYISCYCGGTEFLKIPHDMTQNSTFVITTSTGATVELSLAYHTSTGVAWIAYVYICESCIVLIPRYQTQNFGMICKDTDGSTCFYAITAAGNTRWTNANGLTDSLETCNIWAISCADAEIRSYNAYFNNADNTSGRMLGMPICTFEHRIKDVWFPAIRQFVELTEPIGVDIDGVEYLINRGFAARS